MPVGNSSTEVVFPDTVSIAGLNVG